MASKVIRTVILGAPGSGKGTISKRIVKNFGFVHIAAGDILRLNIQEGTSLGRAAKQFIEKGQLVPDDLVVKCILEKLAEVPNKPWLLDGFPRTVAQAKTLHDVDPVDTVISLKVPNEVIIDRIKGRWVHLPSGRVYNTGFNEPKTPFKDDVTGENLVQRVDDHPDIVQKRLEVYEATIHPVLQFYNDLNILYEYEGRETNQIWPNIEKFLEERTKEALLQSI